MKDQDDKVWYACYGSNMLTERFWCYIRGGQPKGAKTVYSGCSDKSLPTDSEEFYISSELYFARNSDNWDKGGVAFIRTSFAPNASTMGRLYLVTKGQLVDVARQETNTMGDLEIDFDKTIRDGSSIFKDPSWYGNILYLGHQGGYPIFTLTNESDLQTPIKPNSAYIKTIIEGIKEAHKFDKETILDYLKGKKGIAGNYQDSELLDIINS